MVNKCPIDGNAEDIDQSKFWSPSGLNWDEHRIGWAIAGGCAVITVILTTISVLLHCRNYTNRAEQRQIIRILYMPAVFAIISFFSYRFYRNYTYYALVPVAYEAITLGAFLLLLVEYVASTATGRDARKAIARKDKTALPIPFCCWRYRPTKAYFMYSVKWAVLQYVIVKPLVTIAGIICERYDVLCEVAGFDFKFAKVYLEIVDFISISIALYGLILFYDLTKEELKGRRPLAKFLCIKLIVMATFYQSFVIGALENKVIRATKYWTVNNISNGLNALAICIEMVFFSIAMWWAYTSNEYRVAGAPKTSIWRPLWDSINISDFAVEILGSLKYFFCARKLSVQDADDAEDKLAHHQSFGEAFGVSGHYQKTAGLEDGERVPGRPDRLSRISYDEDVALAPYPQIGIAK